MSDDIFSDLNNLFTKETFDPDKKLNIYMMNKFLSLYSGTFDVADKANKLSCKLPDWAMNYYLYFSIPKMKSPRIKYPKKEKIVWSKELISKIIQVYHCSENHAIQIIEIFNKTDKKLLESFGVK